MDEIMYVQKQKKKKKIFLKFQVPYYPKTHLFEIWVCA